MITTDTCPQCGGALGTGDDFCAHCGALVHRCPGCEGSLSATAALCPRCGAPVNRQVPSDPLPLPPGGEDSLWADLVDRLRRATLGEFDIGPELGRGGMAAVFLAHEFALDRKVAIKVMAPGLLLGEGMVDRFRHEAVTIASLHHPNIVSVYSVRQAEGLQFFVMQYVQGRSLDHLIRQVGKLSLPIARSILHQVGSALAYAHRRRIVHRDIKPANILVDDDGHAVVTDFGIAKAAESPTRTMTGALVGTPAYMSPEQCRGGEVSGASDQYSLGAVAYEMLTGEPPFGGSTFTVLQAQVEVDPRPLREHLPDCPAEVEAAVLRMLAKDPAARWPRVGDAMAALGAEPLAEDDPMRLELSRLAAAAAPAPPQDMTPTSPVPRTQPSAAWRKPGTAVSGVAILPPPAGLEAGDSFALVALPRGSNGSRLPADTVTWSVDPPGVLQLNLGRGLALAVAAGSTRLIASCRGVRAELAVEVAPPGADEIVIEPPEHGVRAGDEIHLEATARDKRGRLIARPVTWQTADPGTARVTAQGTLIAQAPGLARLTAVLDSVRSSIVIPVLPARVAALRIGEPPPAVEGDTITLAATPVDRWGGPLEDRTVLWSSSDVRVAVVAAGGRVHALRAGSVVLTASCEGISETVRLQVGAAATPLATPGHWRLRRRRPRRYLAGTLAAAAAAGVLVWLQGGTDRSTVSGALPRTGTSVEEPAVGDSGTIASIAITSQPRRVLRPGGAMQMAAEARDSRGQPVPDALIGWTSSDSSVLRVDPRSGWVRAVAPGQAHLVAKSGERRESTLVAVRLREAAPTLGSIAITQARPLRVGEPAMLHAILLDTRGALFEDTTLTWVSSDPSVLSVDPRTGEVRGEAPGTALVTARAGGASATAEILVLPPAVAGVIIQGARPLAVGERLALQGIPTDAEGLALRDREVSWSSSDTTVLQVDRLSGMLLARAPGSVDVTATSEDAAGVAQVTVFARDRSDAAGTDSVRDDPAILAGVERCYGALESKNTDLVAALYRPVTRSDAENLRKLTRILRTRHWSAVVGPREDGSWMVGRTAATVDFSVSLQWKQESGSRRSEPLLRADFARGDDGWTMSSCRIVGTPNL